MARQPSSDDGGDDNEQCSNKDRSGMSASSMLTLEPETSPSVLGDLCEQSTLGEQDEDLSRQSTSIDKDLSLVVNAVHMRQSIEAAVAECKFVVTIADPRLPDCPLIAVSEEFTNLTGFQRTEILGVNCRFLNQGCDMDPSDLMCLRMTSKTGAPYTAVVPNRKKSGELFLNLLDVRGLTVAKDRVTQEDIWFLIGIQADVTDLAEDEVPQDHMVDLQRMADGIRSGITKEIKEMAIAGVQENAMLSQADQSTWQILDQPVWRTHACADPDPESVAAVHGGSSRTPTPRLSEELAVKGDIVEEELAVKGDIVEEEFAVKGDIVEEVPTKTEVPEAKPIVTVAPAADDLSTAGERSSKQKSAPFLNIALASAALLVFVVTCRLASRKSA